MSGIDWNAELKKIEREFDGLPPEPTPDERRSQRETERRARELEGQRRVARGARVRLALVAVLAVAIVFWPYGHACGVGLFTLLGAQLAVVVGGLWTVVYTWRGRLARSHAVAMLIVLWGLVLLAAQILPRTGYARTPTGTPAPWMCAGSTS